MFQSLENWLILQLFAYIQNNIITHFKSFELLNIYLTV